MESRGRVKPSVRTVWNTAMGPRSASHTQFQTCLNGIIDISLSLGCSSDPCLPCSALHGSLCLSHVFTGSAKLTLEKQTSQPNLVMALCRCNVQAWPLAGPIKWNRPSVKIRSVFQNPVTYTVLTDGLTRFRLPTHSLHLSLTSPVTSCQPIPYNMPSVILQQF